MNIKKLLGKRIKEIRKMKKLTQEQIAEIVQIEPASISNIENGKYYPTAENLDKILVALDVAPEHLFKIEHHKENHVLIEEINVLLNKYPEKVKEFYKIIKALTE